MVKTVNDHITEALELLANGKIKQALTILVNLLQDGVLEVIVHLADIYRSSGNIREMISILLYGIEQGDNMSMFKLGLWYHEKSEWKFMKIYYKMAANAGNTLAMVNLGMFYLSNDNAKKGINYYKMAAKLNNVVAISNLGNYYMHINQNIDKMLKYHTKAAAHGSAISLIDLVDHYKNVQDYENMFTYANAGKDIPQVCMTIGHYYSSVESYDDALEWYYRCIDQSYLLAYKFIAEIHWLNKNYYQWALTLVSWLTYIKSTDTKLSDNDDYINNLCWLNRSIEKINKNKLLTDICLDKIDNIRDFLDEDTLPLIFN